MGCLICMIESLQFFFIRILLLDISKEDFNANLLEIFSLFSYVSIESVFPVVNFLCFIWTCSFGKLGANSLWHLYIENICCSCLGCRPSCPARSRPFWQLPCRSSRATRFGGMPRSISCCSAPGAVAAHAYYLMLLISP